MTINELISYLQNIVDTDPVLGNCYVVTHHSTYNSYNICDIASTDFVIRNTIDYYHLPEKCDIKDLNQTFKDVTYNEFNTIPDLCLLFYSNYVPEPLNNTQD